MRFWKDRWCGDDSLKVSFLGLFSIATTKDDWVANCGSREVEVIEIRCSLGRIMGEVEAFFRKLQGQMFRRDIEDMIVRQE